MRGDTEMKSGLDSCVMRDVWATSTTYAGLSGAGDPYSASDRVTNQRKRKLVCHFSRSERCGQNGPEILSNGCI